MRLLKVRTLQPEVFIGDEIPAYDILSHTWHEGEVSFQDILTPDAQLKAGYTKRKHSAHQAALDGLAYLWIDTCCIDKTSSAEISEAINSMYRWYQKSAVCYAYLPDVNPNENPELKASAFARSRWFTRGWTL